MFACNACGRQGEVQLGGFSRVVDPTGRVVAECGDGEESIVVQIDTERVSQVRTEFPVIADRLTLVDYAALSAESGAEPGAGAEA